MMIPCRECQANISRQASWCPHCGMPTEESTPVNVNVRAVPKPPSHTARQVVGGIVALGCILFLAYAILLSGITNWNHVWYALIVLMLAIILAELP